MAEQDALALTGVGMLTSLGQTAQSHAAMLAGLSRIQEWPDFHLRGPDEEFDPPEPMRAAPAALGWEGAHPWDRLVDLALPALDECLETAGVRRQDLAGSRLALCLRPPAAPETPEALQRYVFEAISRYGGLPPFRDPRAYFEVHAAFAVALADAARELRAGTCEICLVGGVDSFADPKGLEKLDREFRLKGARSPDGYVPGEAAVFVALESAERARRRGARPLGLLETLALAEEPHPLGSEQPSAAEGLCDAVRKVAERWKRHSGHETLPAWVLSDQNGERHRAREWSLALTRLAALFGGEVRLWHPAANFGDTGPAALPLLAAMAAETWRRGDAPGEAAMLLASSDGATRAAVLLRRAAGAD